jgi:hypothetical protein
MPSYLIACLVFILTHAVVAQADFTSAAEPSTRLSAAHWQVTHVGSAQLGELSVEAALEVTEQHFEVPEALAGRLQTLISIEPVTKKSFRLHLTAGDLRADYDLAPELLSGEHAFREGFVSIPSLHHEYTFVVSPLDGGAFRVICKRKADGAPVSEFSLNPVNI